MLNTLCLEAEHFPNRNVRPILAPPSTTPKSSWSISRALIKDDKVYVVKSNTNYTAIRILRLNGFKQRLHSEAKERTGNFCVLQRFGGSRESFLGDVFKRAVVAGEGVTGS